jgi:2-polyprenyl-6-methoxyphenol hydroxylase-like FAD-dependent oxidoreductase
MESAMQFKHPILIAGAGIGGLMLGIALRRFGFEVQIYEQASRLEPIGFGLSIAPNALLALRHIGLDRAVEQIGCPIRVGQIKTAQGKLLQTIGLEGLQAKVGGTMVALHRGRLHQVLLETFGANDIYLDSTVQSFREERSGVILVLKNGIEVKGALLVGADGVRSTIRRQLCGDTCRRYSGYTAWRGLCPVGELLPQGVGLSVLESDKRFGGTTLADGTIYWYVSYLSEPNQERDIAPHTALLPRYQTWCSPVPEIVANTPETAIVHTDIYDCIPLRRWSSQRVTLLGDAAHPMTPDMGQGACQAIEDAVVLAHALEQAPSLDIALQHYEQQRIERTSRIVQQFYQVGKFEHTRNPLLVWLRDALYAWMPPKLLLNQLAMASSFQLASVE